MKFLKASRQPFVGLALMAAIGIVIADVVPLPCAALTVVAIILAAGIVILAYRPVLLATYIIVGLAFSSYTTFRRASRKASNLLMHLAAGHELLRQPGVLSLNQGSRPAGLRRCC